MKLQILSDIHVEFAPFVVPETDADVIVFAGDIGTKLQGIDLANRCAKRVIYVAGNHEYYGAALPKLTDEMREAAGPNVAFLENDEIVIGGVRFLGATLWTDFRLFGDAQREYCMMAAREQMNDFRKIRCSPKYHRLTPQATAVFHHETMLWLRKSLECPFSGPTVVVTHHAPSIKSLEPRYRDDPLAAAFISDLEGVMDGAKVPLWVHGHTHHCVDYLIAGTRVLSNQRGYPNEPSDFNPGLVVDISGTSR